MEQNNKTENSIEAYARDPASVRLFGYEIYGGTFDELLAKLRYDFARGARNVIFAMNALKFVMADDDAALHGALERADILIPDGAGVIYKASKREPVAERITGIDLMLALCKLSAHMDSSIFIYGATQENLEKAVANLSRQCPGINIAGCLNGYQNDEEFIKSKIRASNADVLFVACGTPVQEFFIDRNKAYLPNVKIFLGVGGAIDVFSGSVKRAPEWVRNLRLEWLHRMIMQPRRFIRLKELFRFVAKK